MAFTCSMCGNTQPSTSTTVLSRYPNNDQGTGGSGSVTTSNSGNNTGISKFSCVFCGAGREAVRGS